MATVSDNTKGNKYHDEMTGEFTSKDNINIGGETQQQMQNNLSQNNLSQKNPNVKSFKLKFKDADIIKNELQRNKQVSSIPFLNSATDVEFYIEQYFSEEVIKSIDDKFGKFSIPYKYFNLRTDPKERCGVNIFAACIGKKRWQNNYLKMITEEEAYKNRGKYKFIFRGIKGNDSEYQIISDSYSSKENEMIYGSSGGTCYGIAFYSSTSEDEATSYGGHNNEHVMHLILNKNARTMSYDNIVSITNDLRKRKDFIVPRVEQIFLKSGIEPTRANQMAKSFGITLGDEGFVAMLCGIEWYNSGSYHMVENLGSMYRILGY